MNSMLPPSLSVDAGEADAIIATLLKQSEYIFFRCIFLCVALTLWVSSPWNLLVVFSTHMMLFCDYKRAIATIEPGTYLVWAHSTLTAC